MARDRQRHARAREVSSAAPPVDAASSPIKLAHRHAQARLSLVKATKKPRQHSAQSHNLARIRSCLQTVAILLETNHA
jgi:hypothetical protein